MTLIKTKTAQPMGEYKPTGIDQLKASVDFRLTEVYRKNNRIVWSDGRSELVTDRKLASLQAAHTWTTDF